jgi:hypothetical protein
MTVPMGLPYRSSLNPLLLQTTRQRRRPTFVCNVRAFIDYDVKSTVCEEETPDIHL